MDFRSSPKIGLYRLGDTLNEPPWGRHPVVVEDDEVDSIPTDLRFEPRCIKRM
jgi:hypothetical protein